MQLTRWGKFVMLHTVLTPATFWDKLHREIDRMVESGEDWTVAIEERINGLKEYAQMVEREGTDWVKR